METQLKERLTEISNVALQNTNSPKEYLELLSKMIETVYGVNSSS
jgi:hypothetical protein